nr:hypothetical protein KitaXyl93_43550 [Kitasatospora sp. Xyl93]
MKRSLSARLRGELSGSDREVARPPYAETIPLRRLHPKPWETATNLVPPPLPRVWSVSRGAAGRIRRSAHEVRSCELQGE